LPAGQTLEASPRESVPAPDGKTLLPQVKSLQENESTPRSFIISPTGSALTIQEAQQLLQKHNKARADVGVQPLFWSKKLAAFAQEWANHLAATSCRIEHRPQEGKWTQIYGENLFIGTSGYYNVTDAVTAWEDEKRQFRKGPLNPSGWYAAAHYTQIVWSNTRNVGCSKADCTGSIIVVCNYDPPGNILGQPPF
jgi:pathogenesis-related protein 1